MWQNCGFLWSLECIGIVVRGVRGVVVGCGHQWREERKRQSGAYADRLSRHPVLANHHSETSRQAWNHYSCTLLSLLPAPRENATSAQLLRHRKVPIDLSEVRCNIHVTRGYVRRTRLLLWCCRRPGIRRHQRRNCMRYWTNLTPANIAAEELLLPLMTPNGGIGDTEIAGQEKDAHKYSRWIHEYTYFLSRRLCVRHFPLPCSYCPSISSPALSCPAFLGEPQLHTQKKRNVSSTIQSFKNTHKTHVK